jgi:hypothetical protein
MRHWRNAIGHRTTSGIDTISNDIASGACIRRGFIASSCPANRHADFPAIDNDDYFEWRLHRAFRRTYGCLSVDAG